MTRVPSQRTGNLGEPGNDATTEQPDTELVVRARGGDDESFVVLYERHFESARRLAGVYASSPADAEDIASEGFAQVLGAIRAGGGPRKAFRPYVLTVVRRLAACDAARGKRATPTPEMEAYAPLLPFEDPVLAELEASLVGRAFAALPERWQSVLWHTAVEGESPAQVAPRLGMSPNAVAALACRAREGLRKEYLQAHLSEREQLERECRKCARKLAAYLRGSLGERDRRRVEGHLDQCDRCAQLLLELREVSGSLRGILAPLILGPLFAGYFESLVEALSDDATEGTEGGEGTEDATAGGVADGGGGGTAAGAVAGGSGPGAAVVTVSAVAGLSVLTVGAALVMWHGSTPHPRPHDRAHAPTSPSVPGQPGPSHRTPPPPQTSPSQKSPPGGAHRGRPQPNPEPDTPGGGPAPSHPESSSPASPTPSSGNSPSSPPSSLVSDGNLETPKVAAPGTFDTYTAGQSMGPWKVTSGAVDLIGTGYWQAADGDQSLDLNHADAGAVAQTFATKPGARYVVSYELAGNPEQGKVPPVKTGQVLIDGRNVQNFQFDVTDTNNEDMGYVQRKLTFVARSSQTTLGFASTTANSATGPVIDGVKVVPS